MFASKHVLPSSAGLLMMLVLMLAACAPAPEAPIEVPAGARAGDVTPLQPCEYHPADSKLKYAAECGTLTVPENWDETGSRLIALPVVRLRASAPNAAEPVFLLRGGPGAPNLSWEPPDWLVKDHDVILVGYRGAEGSVQLQCHEFDPVYKAHVGRDLFSDEARAESLAAVRQCAENLRAGGVDIAGYTMPGVVEDMEAVRRALGYDRIDVLSESYGTRLAQIYAYMHPESLRRMVLLGVNTPGGFIWRPEDFDKLIAHMSELCAGDPACSSRTPDLSRTMYEVDHNMATHWLFFRIDPATVRVGTHALFFRNPQMPMVIDAYLAAGAGDPSGLAMMNFLATLMPAPQLLGDLFSKAVSADLELYPGLAAVSLGQSVLGAPLSENVWPGAEAWPMPLIRADLRDFQPSDVEMLLVNGTLDFSTPDSRLEAAKPYYHKAQVVLLPEFGHTPDLLSLQPRAFERLVTSYYDTGVADASLYVYEPLSFRPGMSLPVVAKVLAAVMVLLAVLIVLGVRLVVRRMSRRQARAH
jgi:pimeloyl-ACP methyl ester carboxylesterase